MPTETRASPPRRPAYRRGLHRDAVDALGLRIASGDLAMGATLPNEADLGRELEVSRTVVREAVKVLASKGLVMTRPRTGTRVQPRSQWDVIDHDVLDWIVAAGPSRDFYDDLFEVRSIFEPHAAELAAQRRSDEDVARLLEIMGLMVAAGDDREAYTTADLQLHTVILEASRNELLLRLSGTLGVALRAGRAITTRIPAGPSSSIPLHRAVTDAIESGDPEAARDSMRALLRYARRDMETVLSADPA